MNHWKIATSIYNKIISKCPQGTYQRQLTKTPEKSYVISTYYGVSFDERKGTDFQVCSPNNITAFKKTLGSHTRFLNFDTAQEQYNAWQSYLTKFARFCIMLDESTKLAPYMNNYTEPWTDKRFKEHFKLTDIEWQLIDTVIKD